jgi:hypothetical protein
VLVITVLIAVLVVNVRTIMPMIAVIVALMRLPGV